LEHATTVLVIVGSGAAAFAVSAFATRLLEAAGTRAGALDSPGASGHAKHLRPVPNVGGVAIAGIALGAMALALAACAPACHPTLARLFGPEGPGGGLAESVGRLPEHAGPLAWLAGGTLALHLLGLVDDRRALGAWPKLAVQVAVAVAVAGAGGFRALTLLDAHAGGPWLSVALSAAFIVVLSNAMNFLDNMDGLAGGVGAIAALALAFAAGIAHQWATAGLLAVLAGAVLGFLTLNFPWRPGARARIFMGDGGSLPLGFLLAALAMQITFTSPDEPGYALGTRWYGVLSPLVILAVPLYDAFTVTALRMAQGRSPMVGDQQHFSHRLVMRGLSRRGAVLLICALSAACGVSGLLLGTAAPWQAALIGVQVAVIVGTLAALERPMLRSMAEARE
jgi:UDP-GlcNAc:undecaprenyl-phosphate GlcNAc-1-phosphate transferase